MNMKIIQKADFNARFQSVVLTTNQKNFTILEQLETFRFFKSTGITVAEKAAVCLPELVRSLGLYNFF